MKYKKTLKATDIILKGGLIVDKEMRQEISFVFTGEKVHGAYIEGTLIINFNGKERIIEYFDYVVGNSIHDEVREILKKQAQNAYKFNDVFGELVQLDEIDEALIEHYKIYKKAVKLNVGD